MNVEELAVGDRAIGEGEGAQEDLVARALRCRRRSRRGAGADLDQAALEVQTSSAAPARPAGLRAGPAR